MFNGNLFIIRFFVLCFFLRCGLDIQWHPATVVIFCCEGLLCQESALSIWLWRPSEWKIVGLQGSDCEFRSRFMVKSSQVKGRIQVPSGCWILLYTMFHVFAQYDSCFTIFNMFHLTSPVPIVFILLSNYHLLSVDITPIGIVLMYSFLAEFSMLPKQRKWQFTKHWSHTTLSLAKSTTPETSRFANFEAKQGTCSSSCRIGTGNTSCDSGRLGPCVVRWWRELMGWEMTKLPEITSPVVGKDLRSYQQVPKHILFTK